MLYFSAENKYQFIDLLFAISGSKSSCADGEFIVLLSKIQLWSPVSLSFHFSKIILLQQTRFQAMSESIVSKNILSTSFSQTSADSIHPIAIFV